MKHYILITLLLISRITLSGQVTDNSKIRFNTIDGGSWGRVPALEKKDLSDTVLFKTEGGLFEIKINNLIHSGKQDQIIISVFIIEQQECPIDFLALLNKQVVRYQVEAKGFGNYSGNISVDNNYEISARIRLFATGYPDYFLEFPVFVHLATDGIVESLSCIVPEDVNYFQLYPAIR